ncbi:MAG: 50S ribosomal protein L40e [Candidatus Diapherotrites archaeon]
MAKTGPAEARNYENMWICRNCNAKNRSSRGKKPDKCRKCGSKDFRIKKKRKIAGK